MNFITETQARENAESGMFYHVINRHFNTVSDAVDHILHTASLNAEICCSREGDYLLSLHDSYSLIMCFRGKAEASFPYDCWSDVREDGTRFPKEVGNPNRSEHWVNPSHVEFVGLLSTKRPEYINYSDQLIDSILDTAFEREINIFHLYDEARLLGQEHDGVDRFKAALLFGENVTFEQLDGIDCPEFAVVRELGEIRVEGTFAYEGNFLVFAEITKAYIGGIDMNISPICLN